MGKRRRNEAAEHEVEGVHDVPRKFKQSDQRELLPVKQQDGSWKRQHTKKEKKKALAAPPPPPPRPRPSARELEEIASSVESAEEKRLKISKLSALLVEAPQKNMGSLVDLLRIAKRNKAAPSIQRLALLSAVAVLRDLIPAYRIRPPTEKELEMQVSREVMMLRDYEKTLLSEYTACIGALVKWVRGGEAQPKANRAAGVRGLCALLEKGYDFNQRDELIAALVPIANSNEATERSAVCACLVSVFGLDAQGEATLSIIKQCASLLKTSGFNVKPALLDTWLFIKIDAGATAAAGAPAGKRAKRKKREMDNVSRELAAAAGERGNKARTATQVLDHVFVS